MRKLIIIFICAYRYCISPFLGYNCRYTPTCSEYAIESVQRFGVFKGLFLATKRLLTCHPWGKSGYDPVPHDHS